MLLKIITTLLIVSMTACLKPSPPEITKAEVIAVSPNCIQFEINPAPAGCNMSVVINEIIDKCCKVACATKLFSSIAGCAADIMVASQCTIYDIVNTQYSVCDCDVPVEPNIQND